MTTRYKALTVILKEDTREDDCQTLIMAINRFRGVLSVQPIAAECNDLVERVRVYHEVHELLMKNLIEWSLTHEKGK